MNIGIFGDSYADPVSHNPTPTWIKLLNQHPNFHASSYAVSASNLYYSVEQFKKFYTRHERNIFVATHPGRIWLRASFPHDPYKFISGISTIEAYLDYYKNFKEPEKTRYTKIFNALEVYIAHIQDNQYEYYLQGLMLQELLSLDKNLIIIPCFGHSNSPIDVNGNLFSIFEKENKAWGIDGVKLQNSDIRNCHMTAENNAILAQKIIDHLENGNPIDLNIDHFVAPSLDSKDFYIKNI